MTRRWGILGVLVGVVLLAPPAGLGAAEIRVGPNQPVRRIEDAVARARAGDVILVEPSDDAGAYARTAVYVTTPRLTIRSADPKRRLLIDGTGFDYSGRGPTPRAIFQFNPGADGCTLEGFELTHARNASHNGAGVRINAANGVTVRNCHIHRNDMGIMSNGELPAGTGVGQVIESCLIERNGNADHAGYNHNLYLGGTSVTVRGCVIRFPLTGHNLKSRAHRNVIVANLIYHSANRELDLVDDRVNTAAANSDAVVAGNVIVKDPRCPGNRGVIHFGQDGGNVRRGTLHLLNNTIHTPFVTPVVHLSSADVGVNLLNNVVLGGRSGGQVLISGLKDVPLRLSGRSNWIDAAFGDLPAGLEGSGRQRGPTVVDAAGLDYRLRWPTGAGEGVPWPAELLTAAGGRMLEYRAPLGYVEREDQRRPALGALGRLAAGAATRRIEP